MALEYAPQINDTYQVASDGQISVVATVGSGQPGSVFAYLDNQFIGSTQPGSMLTPGLPPGILALPLGLGAALVGRVLMLVSTVTDVRPETDLTGVYYTLRGGVAPKAVPHEHTVQAHLNSVVFAATFTFIA